MQVPHPIPSETREEPAVGEEIPVFLPPDEQRVATRGDVHKAQSDIRREMRLYLVIGVATGNVAAALVGSYFARDTAPIETALEFASRFLS